MKVLRKSYFLKSCLLHNLTHFYHRTHYANGQRQALLCQRAAAFRGSVQVHQVLMSQERNQQRHLTLHFTPAHSSEVCAAHRYSRAVSFSQFSLI